MPVEWQLVSIAIPTIIAIYSAYIARSNAAHTLNKDQTQQTQDQDTKHEALVVRVVAIETKMGLLWGLVEDHMSKFILSGNPIDFTPEEKEAATAYARLKNHTSTALLRKLEYGIERELITKDDIPADEIMGFTFILASIKNQLVDRGEAVQRRVYGSQ